MTRLFEPFPMSVDIRPNGEPILIIENGFMKDGSGYPIPCRNMDELEAIKSFISAAADFPERKRYAVRDGKTLREATNLTQDQKLDPHFHMLIHVLSMVFAFKQIVYVRAFVVYFDYTPRKTEIVPVDYRNQHNEKRMVLPFPSD